MHPSRKTRSRPNQDKCEAASEHEQEKLEHSCRQHIIITRLEGQILPTFSTLRRQGIPHPKKVEDNSSRNTNSLRTWATSWWWGCTMKIRKDTTSTHRFSEQLRTPTVLRERPADPKSSRNDPKQRDTQKKRRLKWKTKTNWSGLGGSHHSYRKSYQSVTQTIPCKHKQIWMIVFAGNCSIARQQCPGAQRASRWSEIQS